MFIVIFQIGLKALECQTYARIRVTTEILLKFMYIPIPRNLDFSWQHCRGDLPTLKSNISETINRRKLKFSKEVRSVSDVSLIFAHNPSWMLHSL